MTPRLRPLDPEEIPPDLLDLPAFRRSGRAVPFNIYRTLAHHPDLLRQWLVFSEGIRFTGRLPERDRELLILRTGWNCRSEYEWGQHVAFGRRAGMTDAELLALCQPVEEGAWTAPDRALLQAADELHKTATLSDEVWSAMASHYDEAQLVEACMLVGQYHLVSFSLNALRVERDEGLPPFPSPP
ncbi:MAG: carboxymuconolactone decarboxylase family protein [Mycobacteriales bacterium]